MIGRVNMDDIYEYCKEIDNWPNSWKFDDGDIEIGERIVHNVFIPFFHNLIEAGLSKRTIQRHISNIWLLGGEIIEIVYEEEEFRKLDELSLVLRFIDDEGGPLSKHNDTEEEMRSFDSSCKKLYKYLAKKK